MYRTDECHNHIPSRNTCATMSTHPDFPKTRTPTKFYSLNLGGILFVIFLSLSVIIHEAQSLRCVQCTSETDDNCKCNPPQPTECPKMYDHCITVTERERLAPGTGAREKKGKIKVFTRSCSPENLGNGVCIKGRTPEGDAKEICYTTCTEDGCNDKKLSADDSCTPGAAIAAAGGAIGDGIANAWDKTKQGTKDAINATGDAFNAAGDKINQKAAEIAARSGSPPSSILTTKVTASSVLFVSLAGYLAFLA